VGRATHGRKGVRGGRRDGLAAQRENTVGKQRWGSRLVRDAEGGGRKQHSTELKEFFRRRSSNRVPLIG
jgi:hypothetical protein